MKYIVVDLEATCWEKRNGRRNEIIEIGAVCINEKKSIIDEFDSIVKPYTHPMLSDFCTQLTSITQSMVDEAPRFPEALKAFQDWILNLDNQYILCSWGHYDRVQFKNDCELHGLDTAWLEAHISVKHAYGKLKRMKRPPGMKKALKMEKLALTGTHHRGIDDAKNIAKIFIKNFNKWRFPKSIIK